MEGDVGLISNNRSDFLILDNLSLFLISYSTFSNAIRLTVHFSVSYSTFPNAVQLTVHFPNSTGADRHFLKLNASSKSAEFVIVDGQTRFFAVTHDVIGVIKIKIAI